MTSLHSVLLHEIGHVIGMDHIESCTDPAPASIMHTFYNANESEHLKGPEIGFVNNSYGVRSNDGSPQWTPDAQAWLPGGGVFSGSVSSYGRLAASNSRASGNNVYVGWTFGNVFLTRYTPAAWTTVGVVFFDSPPRPIYHPGVASRGSQAFVAWLGNRDVITGMQDVLSIVYDESGAIWSPIGIVAEGAARTANAGVSATYDPASDAFIAVWRGSTGADRNSIAYRVVGQSPTPWVLSDPVSGRGVKASDTPSIACGDPQVLGPDNCLIAWIDGSHWQRPVRWTQGRVGPSGQLVLNDVKTHPYVTVGSASVAYWSEDEFPWIIALNQGGTTTYTWRKRASFAANFEGERSLTSSTNVTLPAAGSRIRGSEGRGYVFILKLVERLALAPTTSRVIE
jgi:hypothetical protein